MPITVSLPPELRDRLHPMHHRWSPLFAAILCYLLDLPPMTHAAPGSKSLGRIESLSTTSDGFLLANYGREFIGDVDDLERNLRLWLADCSEEEKRLVQELVDHKVNRTYGCRRVSVYGG